MISTNRVICSNCPEFTQCSSCWRANGIQTNHRYSCEPLKAGFNSNLTKRLVQNFKNKLRHLQNESTNLTKQPKQKTKDYYRLMFQKINTLDNKLQNLEDLLVTHLYRDSDYNCIVNCENNNEYLELYKSVRSLLNLASNLKKEMVCKKHNIQNNNQSASKLYDKINGLEEELQDLSLFIKSIIHSTIPPNFKNGTKQANTKSFPSMRAKLEDHYRNNNRFDMAFQSEKFSSYKNHNNQKGPDLIQVTPMCVNYLRNSNNSFPRPSCLCLRCAKQDLLTTELCDNACFPQGGPSNNRYKPRRTKQPRMNRYGSNCSCKQWTRFVSSGSNNRNRSKAKNVRQVNKPSDSISSCSCSSCSNNECNIVYKQPIQYGDTYFQKPLPKNIQSFQMKKKKENDCLHRVKKTFLRSGNNMNPFYKEVEISCYKPTLKSSQHMLDQEYNVTNYNMGLTKNRPLKGDTKGKHRNNANSACKPHKVIQSKILQENAVYYQHMPNKTNFIDEKSHQYVYRNTNNSFEKQKMNERTFQNKNGKKKTRTKIKHGIFHDKKNYSHVHLSASNELEQGFKEENRINYNYANNSDMEHFTYGSDDVSFVRTKKSTFQKQNINSTDQRKINNHEQPTNAHFNDSNIFQNQLFNEKLPQQRSKCSKKIKLIQFIDEPNAHKSYETIQSCYEFNTSEISDSEVNCYDNDKAKFETDRVEEKLSQETLSSSSSDEDPRKVLVIEKLKETDSDVCEHCIVKEKTEQIHPHKQKNCKKQIIIRKEIIRCPSCRHKFDEKVFEAINDPQLNINDYYVERTHKRKMKRHKNKKTTKFDEGNNQSEYFLKYNHKSEMIRENGHFVPKGKNFKHHEKEVPVLQAELAHKNVFQSSNTNLIKSDSFTRPKTKIAKSFENNEKVNETNEVKNNHDIYVVESRSQLPLNSRPNGKGEHKENTEEIKIASSPLKRLEMSVKESDSNEMRQSRPILLGSPLKILKAEDENATEIGEEKYTRPTQKLNDTKLNEGSEILQIISLSVEKDTLKDKPINKINVNNTLKEKGSHSDKLQNSSVLKYDNADKGSIKPLYQPIEHKKSPQFKNEISNKNERNSIDKNLTEFNPPNSVEKETSKMETLSSDKKPIKLKDHYTSNELLVHKKIPYKKYSQLPDIVRKHKNFGNKPIYFCECSQTTSSKLTTDSPCDCSNTSLGCKKSFAFTIGKKPYKPLKSRYRYTNYPKKTKLMYLKPLSRRYGSKSTHVNEEPPSVVSQVEYNKGNNYHNFLSTVSESSFSVVNWEEVAKKLKEEKRCY